MRKHSKLILASLTATLLMALAVSGTASARVFSLSNMNFRVVWSSLEFTNETGFGTVRCRVTLEGSFHSQTISKVEKALIGYISRANVAGERCTGGSATINQESLPWHITYSGFTGRLPTITSIRLLLQNAKFEIRVPGIGPCLAIVEPANQARGEVIVSGGEATNLLPDGSVPIPTSGPLCPANGQFTSPATDGRITLLGNTTRIRVTLI
jgi:hypothetical protein